MINAISTKCGRCDGTGMVAPWGVCFKCNGRGAHLEYRNVGPKILRKRDNGPVRVLPIVSGAKIETYAASANVLDGLRQLVRQGSVSTIEVDGWMWTRPGLRNIGAVQNESLQGHPCR
jgi:hypothetical protein